MGHNNWLHNQLFVMLYQDVLHLYIYNFWNAMFVSLVRFTMAFDINVLLTFKLRTTMHLFYSNGFQFSLFVRLSTTIIKENATLRSSSKLDFIEIQTSMLKNLKQLQENMNTFNFFIDFSTNFFCTNCSKLLPYARLSITTTRKDLTIDFYIQNNFLLNLKCNLSYGNQNKQKDKYFLLFEQLMFFKQHLFS
jgi:hypothetical protein